jgi:hypothetical protein
MKELYDYTNNVAEAMNIDLEPEITLDEAIKSSGIVSFSFKKDSRKLDKNLKIIINPKYSNTFNKMKNTISHELGHIYCFKNHPTLYKIIEKSMIPYRTIGKKFKKNNKIDDRIPVAVTAVSSVTSILSFYTELLYIAIPLCLLTQILVVPTLSNEYIADHYGNKYAKQVSSEEQ